MYLNISSLFEAQIKISKYNKKLYSKITVYCDLAVTYK